MATERYMTLLRVQFPFRVTLSKPFLNIRLGSRHVFGMLCFGELIVSTGINEGHDRKVEWWPPKVRRGEFRAISSWKWFQSY